MSLLGAGWLDADPTSGSVGTMSLVTVAVVRDPDHATPLHGACVGVPSDYRGMEVQTSVTSCDAPEAMGHRSTRQAAPIPPISLIDVGTRTTNVDGTHRHSLDCASGPAPRFRRVRALARSFGRQERAPSGDVA
jgi:hypothetical protein